MGKCLTGARTIADHSEQYSHRSLEQWNKVQRNTLTPMLLVIILGHFSLTDFCELLFRSLHNLVRNRPFIYLLKEH